ncbi:MAG: hypothetical protein WDM89_13065 [Rhizomicrobium sp.]
MISLTMKRTAFCISRRRRRFCVTKSALAHFLHLSQFTGEFNALDISPDGSTLAATNFSYRDDHNSIYLIDLNTLKAKKVLLPKDSTDLGTCTLAYDGTGQILVASWSTTLHTSLKRYDPNSGTITAIGTVDACAMLRTDAAGDVVAIAGSGAVGDGYYGRYRTTDGSLLHNELAKDPFTYEIGVSRDASLFAIPTYNGTVIADSELNPTGVVIGEYAGPQPIGAVFHPTADLVYFPWAGSAEIKAFDTNTWQEVGQFHCQRKFENVSTAFLEGRIKLSEMGRCFLPRYVAVFAICRPAGAKSLCLKRTLNFPYGTMLRAVSIPCIVAEDRLRAIFPET